MELVDDIVPYFLGGGCRERDDRHTGKPVAEHLQVAVIGTKVVSPLGNAVSLVDRNEAGSGQVQEVLEAPCCQSFGSDVEDFEFAAARTGQDVFVFAGGERAVDECCGYAVDAEGVDLIFH